MPARPLWPTAVLSLLPLLWLAAPPPALAQEAPTVKLATNVERSYFPPAEALLRKAYASLGLQVEFVPWPLNRAQLELAAGRLDGVAMRTDTFFAQLPSVRKVDVPLLTLHVYAFARPAPPRSAWRSWRAAASPTSAAWWPSRRWCPKPCDCRPTRPATPS